MYFQVLVWKTEAVERLESLTAKRPQSTMNTPSPPRKYKPKLISTPAVENIAEEHEYARMPTSERARKARDEFRNRTFSARRLLCENRVGEDDMIMDKVWKCKNMSELINVCTETSDIAQALEDKMLNTIDSQLQRLCSTGDFGSVLQTSTTDAKISSIAESAIEELRKCCPVLYKVLVMASSSTTIEKKEDWHLFTLYGVIMQRRSQRFNVLQRLVMAACVRYHAGNEV